MQLRLIKFLIAICLTLGFLYVGCVDEPTLEKIQRPYTMLRIANFSSNVGKITVHLEDKDGKDIFADLQQYVTIPDYRRIQSGQKKITILNAAGDTIYRNEEFRINAYQRATLVFAGYYDKLEANRSFGNFFYYEGEVYQVSAPDADKVHIYFMHTANDSLSQPKVSLVPIATFKPTPTTTKDTVMSSLAYSQTRNLRNTVPGTYYLRFVSGTDTLMKTNYNFSDVGKRYFVFVYGAPNNMKVLIKQFDPLPVMSK